MLLLMISKIRISKKLQKLGEGEATNSHHTKGNEKENSFQ